MSRQETHEEYLQKLKDKNIEVIPLELYIKNTHKIKHKCVCGNTWDVTPKMVKKGHQCGCKVTKPRDTQEKYLNKLKNKNIKVEPIEDYISDKVKIKHRCICGNIWDVKPNAVKNGALCGCTKLKHDFLFYKNKKTILYYIKVNNLYKIGITLYRNKGIEYSIFNRRFGSDVNNAEIKIIDYKIYDDGSKAFETEQKILSKYKNKQYQGIDILRGGNTELFTENILSNFIV